MAKDREDENPTEQLDPFASEPPPGPIDVMLEGDSGITEVEPPKPPPDEEGPAEEEEQTEEEQPQEEEEAPVETQAELPFEPRSPNRVPAKQRIHQLLNDNSLAQAELARLHQENEWLRQQYQATAARSQVIDKAAMDAHEQRWKAEAEAARGALRDAYASQDADRIAEATTRVSAAASEMQAINAYKAQIPAQQPQVQQPRQNGYVPQPQPPQPAPVPPAMRSWVEANPWLDARRAEFDPEMSNYAAQAASVLDARYRRAGVSDQIAGEGYFQELDSMIQQEFPDMLPQTNKPRRLQMPRQSGAAPVAPASRQQPTRVNGGANESVRLSSKEHEFALRMVRNGAYPNYPIGHPRAGQRMSDEDGVRYHAQHVKNDRATQAALKRGL